MVTFVRCVPCRVASFNGGLFQFLRVGGTTKGSVKSHGGFANCDVGECDGGGCATIERGLSVARGSATSVTSARTIGRGAAYLGNFNTFSLLFN